VSTNRISKAAALLESGDVFDPLSDPKAGGPVSVGRSVRGEKLQRPLRKQMIWSRKIGTRDLQTDAPRSSGFAVEDNVRARGPLPLGRGGEAQ